ncbi:glutamate racemase [Clostridium perfringens]|uniref:Glutamate racemase n=1 Tax=Clostridium perfringens TaxID=1502 RepID=A0AAW4J9R6_CLOPF|nr:glutamate racemase [Clostridium perfringens]MBO3342640.1 glutamate racemase [Clostridium perfringens]MBO3345713.1 glutamate racemase [Clostridium perfringens]MBO3348785.1 glutamate racemase [Clostridium perfringens]MBO3352034.1 glutamate racemase [Clostridium perfringens]MBO3357135.1 glutamate racemase [Clostridium perfringens]
MKIVLVKENKTIRILEGTGIIKSNVLGMRSRLTSGEVKYYEFDYDKSLGIKLDAYVEALNEFPNLLEKSKLIKEITF